MGGTKMRELIVDNFAEALVRANVPELCVVKEVA